jgi:hypothetical protein
MLRRIDVVSINRIDYDRLTSQLREFRAAHHPLHYYSAEDVFDKGPALRGNDILVGNSAASENNHLEVFALLKELNLDDRRIVVPLSYGDEPYAAEICRIGTQMFGQRFVPLRQFMPLEEYYAAISTCKVVVMNHIRQQALGNISAAVFKGAKVLLRPENPIFLQFREMGVNVFAIPVSETHTEELLEPLTDEQVRRNQEIMTSYFGFDNLVNQTRGLKTFIKN